MNHTHLEVFAFAILGNFLLNEFTELRFIGIICLFFAIFKAGYYDAQ